MIVIIKNIKHSLYWQEHAHGASYGVSAVKQFEYNWLC